VPIPRKFDRRPPERDETRINERIRVPQVRLVGEDGNQIGVVDTAQALRYAQERDLDLVEVAPEARPPVCRVLDYSKYKYEQEQKAKAARRHQKQVNVREIKLRPKIATNDYETKKNHVVRFLKGDDRVKVTIMFRGREQTHPERGERLLMRLAEDVAELGTIESPVLVTNTLAVGAAWEGGLRHLLDQNPDAARDRDTVNVIVGECFDGWLSDARALAVRPEHALEAIAAASVDEVAEGAVGAGTGTTCFGFKAGVGTSSREVEGFTLGCLIVSNYGARRDLHLLVGAAAADAGDAPEPPAQSGSIMMVLGTDAPMSERQLRRLAARGTFGLGRAGSFATNASGEYVLAFSTAHRPAHRSERDRDEFSFLRDDSIAVRNLFEAAGDVVQESVLNSLCAAEAVEGRDGNHAEEFPYDLLDAVPFLRRD